ncbi:MAG: CapA family protein [Candidatus Saccharibacteria bacterium]|nr:CapA family protein [Candidatus Saccharibacteria bacterium]
MSAASLKFSKKHNKVILSLLFAVAIGCATCLGLIYWQISNNTVASREPVSGNYQPVSVTSAESRILFAGTTFWGRRTNTLARASELGVEYPFAKLNTLERDKYQAWIANLECPVTENDHTEYEEEALLVFNCHIDYLEEAAKYFSAFSLATNHADNWGEEGIVETKENLDEVGIQYFGHYRYDNSTENCGIVVVPVEAQLSNGQVYEYNIPIGFCGAHGVFGIPTAEAFDNIEHYASVLPTIVMPHMGVEYENSADELRQNLYRAMIDRGADMVLADHPHHVQNAEAYNGHLIAYSLGNFMFDQQFDETVYSAAIDATAVFDPDTDFEAWDKLGSICLKQHGDCIDDIIESGLPRLSLTWTNYDFVATTDAGDIQTRLGDDADRAFVGRRLNWDSVVSNLK